ncbi:MAG: winged helix-turn-helix domain-containing protein [Terracidiphilus sp.]
MVLKFNRYELDPAAYQLRRSGRPVRLERLPMELLLLLVERRGALVTREEIASKLWAPNLFHDLDNGIHTAIRKVRQALNDSAERPAFVQTVSGKGYRFVAPVTIVTDSPPSSANRSIAVAVLPFENLTGDASQEYLSDGLTEETIAALGNLAPERLTVIARTSVMRYKRTRKTVEEIAGELGVDYLLESTFRRDEKAVRITSRLVRARDQAQVWSGNYDRDWRSVLQLQEELGKAIAQHVEFRFTAERSISHARQTTADPDAYDLYLRGKHYWNQIRPTALRRAIECFEEAVSKDPSFALAWSGLADTYAVLPVTSDGDPAEFWSKARHAADEAMRLQGKLAESCASSGSVSFWLDWDWSRAERELRGAVLLNPSCVSGYRYLAHVLSNCGRHSEALAAMANACRIDPLSPALHAVSGQLFFQARRFEEAENRARHALALNTDFWLAHLILGKVCEQTHRAATALTEFDAAFRLSEGNTEALSLKGYTLAQMGRRTDAEQVMRALLETAKTRFVPPYNVALLCAGLGDSATAYEWLERARLIRDVHMVFLTVEPKWDPFRRQPSFHSLMQRCGLPEFESSSRLQSPPNRTEPIP